MKNNKGFSLVELIVVIAIMAILAAIAVVSFSIYIDRANDAADFDYLSNLAYLAELYAIENQVGLDSVVVSEDGVHGPEDIGLWIIDPATGEPTFYTYKSEGWESIQEIYDAVGDWDFKGEGFKENTDFIPDFSEGDLDDANNGVEGCEHQFTTTRKEPTCKYSGWEKETCNLCRKETVNVLPATGIHSFSDTPTYEKGRYDYFVCTYDGCNQIKIMSDNGSVIVPVD